jgi:hypothetical protein
MTIFSSRDGFTVDWIVIMVEVEAAPETSENVTSTDEPSGTVDVAYITVAGSGYSFCTVPELYEGPVKIA